MDTKEIIRQIKDGAGWDDLKDLVPPYQQTKIALLHGSGDSPSCSKNSLFEKIEIAGMFQQSLFIM